MDLRCRRRSYPILRIEYGIVFKIKKDGIMQKITTYGCIGIDLDGPIEDREAKKRFSACI
jgi:hypothetical protein